MSFRIILAALTLAAPVVARASDSTETVSFKGQTAVAYGSGGVPLFRGDRDYILAYAGNADGRIFADADGRVRVSADGRKEVWLSCDELALPAQGCAAPAADPQTDDPVPARRTTRGGGVPMCPGDPRCPRIGS